MGSTRSQEYLQERTNWEQIDEFLICLFDLDYKVPFGYTNPKITFSQIAIAIHGSVILSRSGLMRSSPEI